MRSYLRIFGEAPVLSRLELMMLRQAAEDFTLLGDARRRTELAGIVDGYLARVREVVPGTRLGTDFVEPVLAALEQHIERPDRLDVIRAMVPEGDESADTEL